jgi:hypothetical protein
MPSVTPPSPPCKGGGEIRAFFVVLASTAFLPKFLGLLPAMQTLLERVDSIAWRPAPMPRANLRSVVRYVRRALGAQNAPAFTDAQLLLEFCAQRDEEAFAALVYRHGGLVRAVCRRVLHLDAVGGAPLECSPGISILYPWRAPISSTVALSRRICGIPKRTAAEWFTASHICDEGPETHEIDINLTPRGLNAGSSDLLWLGRDPFSSGSGCSAAARKPPCPAGARPPDERGAVETFPRAG